MTDVLDRLEEPLYVAPQAPSPTRATDERARVALAALLAGAAAIHLVMVPPHLTTWAPEGAAFIVAAGIQLLVAFLVLARPSRLVWWAAALANAAFFGAWAVTRTVGYPFGALEGVVEERAFVDVTCAAFEVAAIVLALALLRPRLARSRGLRYAAPIAVVAVIGLTSAVLAAPSTRNHTHDATTARLEAKGFNSFMNGHVHSHVQVLLDPATQKELDRELAITREVARQYPTLRDAEAAGYRRAGPYVPGLGLHMINFGGAAYINPDGVLSDDDLRHPLSLLYDGTGPTAQLGGFMYYAATATEPEGFPGRNDGWHYHEHLCAVPAKDGFLDFPFGPDFGATKAQCDSVGGGLMDSQYMVHVWTVPGWDDMAKYGGVFAEENPRFGCSDGTWFQLPFDQWKTHPLNVCRSGASGHPL
jgi:hypothetical protein